MASISVRWTELAPSTRIPKQTHWIVTKTRASADPGIQHINVAGPLSSQGRRLVCVTSTDTRQQPVDR